MILVIDIKKGFVDSYSTLTKACKENRWMSYQYLKEVKLSEKMVKYKHVLLAKV